LTLLYVAVARPGTLGAANEVTVEWAIDLENQRELHALVSGLHEHFVFDEPVPAPPCLAGKASMGIGGVNACVISRPW
jgi:hypothetical protein